MQHWRWEYLRAIPCRNKVVSVLLASYLLWLNIFVNGAWDLGVKEAKGEYICIMNNDLELTQ